MGILDKAVPGGNITKPILIALGALLAGKMLSGSAKEADNDAETPVDRQVSPPPGNAPHQQTGQAQNPGEAQPPAGQGNGGQGNGGLLDGIDGFLKRLKETGQGETADSWVKPDAQNKPIEPQDIGKAIGGKVPTNDQVAGQLRNSPW